jgi:hypothetical protein
MLATQTLPALRRVSVCPHHYYRHQCRQGRKSACLCGAMRFYQDQIVPVLINWSMRQRNLAAYRGVRNGPKSGQASVQQEQSQTAAKK